MGIRETEHTFVVISPDGEIHKFQIMLGLVDEDSFDFYDDNDRNYITTCSCGSIHPFDRILKFIDFGPIQKSEYPFLVNVDYLAEIMHLRHFDFRQKDCPPILLTVQYYDDLDTEHEIIYNIMDFTEVYMPVQCKCTPETQKYVDKFCRGDHHWVDRARLIYIEINGREVLACANHPFFTKEYSDKYAGILINTSY